MPRKRVKLGDREFESIKSATDYFKDIYKKLSQDDVLVDSNHEHWPLFISLVENRSEEKKNEKIGPGIKHFFVFTKDNGAYELRIKRIDESTIDFSTSKGIKGE